MGDAALQLDPFALALLALLREATEAATAEGLDAAGAATFIGVSVSKWHAMNAGGLCPAPVELGDRCPRWIRSELRSWLLGGAPPRVRWAAMREAALRRSA